jgi:hypothetical protein
MRNKPTLTSTGESIPPPLGPDLQHALVQLFPEFPPWILTPLMGVDYTPLAVDARHACVAPRDSPYRAITLPVAHAWEPPPTVVPWENSGLTEYSLTVEGFTVGLVLSKLWRQYRITLVHGSDLAVAPFGAWLADCTHEEPASTVWIAVAPRAEECVTSPEAHRTLVQRWAAIPDPNARARIQQFWLGHPIPALAALGMATLDVQGLGTPHAPTPGALKR